ncbi:MAG: nitroreductase [Chitinivibrionales bacterium]|nr:nitroreductase [Chitinivibrionales bacterium]
MTFLELAAKRFSVREYRDTPVEESAVATVLEAGRLAPSACNNQPWYFIVIRSPERRAAMRAAYDRDWFVSAPVQIAVCIDTEQCWKRGHDGKSYGMVDAAIAMDHMTLAATELGLGTCWIGAFDPTGAREVLGLPAHIEPVVLTPLGYPASSAPPKKRKALEQIVRRERFG